MNTTAELRKKTPVELRETIHGLEGRLETIRVDLAAGRTKNVKEAVSLRRAIARVYTILGEQNKY